MVWLFSGVCRSKARLDGKRAVVTGANTGIGKETALELAARGCRVVLAVRDTAKGERAAADIRKKLSAQRRAGVPVGEVSVEHLDLASLKSVRACALRLLNDEHKAIHILVNNAGVMACPKAYTEDGHDLQFGVNHLGHFLLTALLLPRIRASVGPAPAGPTPAGPTPAGPTPAGPTPAGPAPAGPAPAGPAPAGPAPAGPTPAEPAPAEQGAAADGHPEPHPDPARIITVSSAAYAFSRIDFDDLRYERGYRPLFAYGRSKLANMLFTRELARRLKGRRDGVFAMVSTERGESGVTTYCLHPGAVATELFEHFDTFLIPGTRFLLDNVGRFFIKTPRQGAQTSIYCAVSRSAARQSGLYYTDCSVTTPFPIGRDDEAARRLWEVSCDIVGLRDYDPLGDADPPAWLFADPPTKT